MLTLLSECHFWTLRDEIHIKPTDFGAFRYNRNQQISEVTAFGKRDYTERRDGTAVLKTSRKTIGRLKNNVKKLEELLRTNKIVYLDWKDATQVLLLFTNGTIAHICVNVYTGDILRMVWDHYLVGKLAAEVITDAFFTRSHILLAYNTNQITVVQLQRLNVQRRQGPEKICNMNPSIFHAIIPGQSDRKLARHLVVNSSFDLFVVWTKSSQNEVYPWQPTVRDQDRANIHIFKLNGTHLESIAYCWTENDPLSVNFLLSTECQILTLEQKVSRKGGIYAEICTYETKTGKMQRDTVTSIQVATQISCYAFSPDQEKLFLGTLDRNIYLYDLVQQKTKFVTRIEIIPTHCTWHSDSSIIMIANDRTQFQCFDLALTPIANLLQSEDVTPSNLLDLSYYFTIQPTLLNISFSRKPNVTNFYHSYAQTDCFLLLHYENGPIGCIRFFSGIGIHGDIHNSGLTADVIVDKYLALNQLDKAVNLLLALNWETYGAMCLISLHKIANYIFFREGMRSARLELMAKALKTFTDSLSDETKDEFTDQVFNLKRRFFFYLLRKNFIAEAFEIAQDIDDYDLFMDLFNLTKSESNNLEFSVAAFNQAACILREEARENGNLSLIPDYGTESDSSQSTNSNFPVSPGGSDNKQQEHIVKHYVPPLPSFKSKVFCAEMIKIKIPKPEIRAVEAVSKDFYHPPLTPSILSNISNSKVTVAKADTPHAVTSNEPSQTKHANPGNFTRINNTPSISFPSHQIVNVPSQHVTSSYNIVSRVSAAQSSIPLSNHSNNHHTVPDIPDSVSPIQKNYPSSTNVRTISTYSASAYQPKFYQHPLVSGNIPPAHGELQKRLQMKKPTASILSNSNTSTINTNLFGGNNDALLAASGNSGVASTNNGIQMKREIQEKQSKNNAAEKNKVKFSDTIQIAEISRKEKPMLPKRNGYARPHRMRKNLLTNPKKELADSLPLCHPNDEYLKDFNPITADNTMGSNASAVEDQSSQSIKSTVVPPLPSAIKVVHFGVV